MKKINLREADFINVLVIDDHKMVRDGLKLMLQSLNRWMPFKVVDAETAESALVKISKTNFELIIIDYRLPGLSGAEVVYRILRFKPMAKILVLSSYDELAYIQSMIDAGAKGYVLKSIEPAEMLKAIKTILSGKVYYCSEVAVKLIDAAGDSTIKIDKAKQLLTRREIEVLRMIAMEMTNEEIAKKLFVAKRTIDSHRQNLIHKLQVKNTVGLVKAAYQLDLISG
ncbi:response regulator transcription factor [Ferruginibacter profundus]